MDIVRLRKGWARLWRWTLALVAGLAVSVFLFAFLSSQTIDLARDAQRAFLEAVREPPPRTVKPGTPEEVANFFVPHFRFEIRVPEKWPRDFTCRRFQVVYFDRSRVAELSGYAGDRLVCLHLLDRKDLTFFPQAQKELVADAKVRAFDVGDARFAAAVKKAFVVSATAERSPSASAAETDALLSDLVQAVLDKY